ncbi:hypothetical protein F5Y11DRAFT_320293 [Daldinia sp. FL1419]|nr:hypothetical protein F5Y11DRAFT_320293 [Daldinia sp. FL1419]
MPNHKVPKHLVSNRTIDKMSPLTLDRLPNEILTSIFNDFRVHYHPEPDSDAPSAYFRGTRQRPDEPSWYSLDCQALYSLCLTSRRLRDVARPLLYRDFMPGYGDSWRSKSYKWEGRLASFLRTVSTRRDLAVFVKRIYIHSFLVKRLDEVTVQSALEQAAQGFSIPLSKYLAHFPSIGIRRPGHDQQQILFAPLLGMLLAALPNANRLSLQVSARSVPIPASALKEIGVPKLRLKTIDISAYSHPDAEASYMFSIDDDTCGILKLATDVETLNLHMCGSLRNPLGLEIRTLRITCSRLDEPSIRNLLSSCVGLEAFMYEAGPPDIIKYSCLMGTPLNENDEHFEPHRIIEYLHSHYGTLKSLHLDFRIYNLISFNRIRPVRPIASLKNLTRLNHLFLNPNMIYSNQETKRHQLIEILPPAITKLQIIGIFSVFLLDAARDLQALADAVLRGEFSQLQKLTYNTFEQLDDHAISESFARAGVEFGHEECPPTGPTILPTDVSPPSSPGSFMLYPLPDSDDDL